MMVCFLQLLNHRMGLLSVMNLMNSSILSVLPWLQDHQRASLLLQPPYITNWFSSYMYESPTLDTTDDFTISDCKEKENGKVCSAQQKNKDVKGFVDIEESADLPRKMRISAVFTKCTNLVKKSVCKDDKIDLKLSSSRLNQSTSASDPEGTQNHNHGSVEKFRNTKADGKDYDVKSHMDAKSLQNSVGNKGLITDGQEKEHVTTGTLDSTVKGNYLTRPTDRTSIGKENDETGLLENGFIATKKKSRHENTENVRKRESVQSKVSRKVLSETSNLHSSNNGKIVEITGKWCCPQKNKPNLGPPLKQLRLEQWVRRL